MAKTRETRFDNFAFWLVVAAVTRRDSRPAGVASFIYAKDTSHSGASSTPATVYKSGKIILIAPGPIYGASHCIWADKRASTTTDSHVPLATNKRSDHEPLGRPVGACVYYASRIPPCLSVPVSPWLRLGLITSRGPPYPSWLRLRLVTSRGPPYPTRSPRA